MKTELEQYDLSLRESDAPDRLPIDFSIEDDEDNVAWVWGDWKDYEVDCTHPYQCIDWGDDDERGECELCGAQCDWRWERDEDGQSREPHAWHKGNGGLIKKIIEEKYER